MVDAGRGVVAAAPGSLLLKNVRIKCKHCTLGEGLDLHCIACIYNVYFLSSRCRDNNLCINVKKTKEIIVDLRQTPPSSLSHQRGSAVEVVSSFRYLGMHISNYLTWRTNTSCLVKKAPLFSEEAQMRWDGDCCPVLFHHCVAWQPLSGRQENSATSN